MKHISPRIRAGQFLMFWVVMLARLYVISGSLGTGMTKSQVVQNQQIFQVGRCSTAGCPQPSKPQLYQTGNAILFFNLHHSGIVSSRKRYGLACAVHLSFFFFSAPQNKRAMIGLNQWQRLEREGEAETGRACAYALE